MRFFSQVIPTIVLIAAISRSTADAQTPLNSAEAKTFTYSHGTCGIMQYNNGDSVAVIDSALISYNQLGQRVGSSASCKMIVPTPLVVAFTTGLENYGNFIMGWNATEAAKKYLGGLPDNATATELDTAMRNWGRELIAAVNFKNSKPNQSNGELGSLIVSYRDGDVTHLYRERILYINRRAVRDEFDSNRVEATGTRHAVIYAGTCRNYINLHGDRETPMSAEDTLLVDGILNRDMSDFTVIDLANLSLQAVKIFAAVQHKYGRENERDSIGPPYQSATSDRGQNSWKFNLEKPCEPPIN